MQVREREGLRVIAVNSLSLQGHVNHKCLIKGYYVTAPSSKSLPLPKDLRQENPFSLFVTGTSNTS